MIEGLDDELAKRGDRRDKHSVIKGSVLHDFFVGGEGDFESCFDGASKVFAAESAEALGLAPINSELLFKRYELPRPFIVKVLLFIGVGGESIGLMARLVEAVYCDPESSINSCISAVADRFELSASAVTRAVDKWFNIYDSAVFDKISYLTKTNPLTAKDALCDIALYVRVKMSGSCAE